MSENTEPQTTVQKSPRGPIEAQAMDVSLDEELGEDVPLASRCYMSNTKEIKLVPEQLAGYTCRWIHFASDNPSFDQFSTMVDDLMREYGDEERRVVQDGLRRFRGQNEVRGSYGPAFRPEFATFQSDASQNDDNWFDDGKGCQYSHDIPAFYSLPTIHFEATLDNSESSPPFTIVKPCASPPPSPISFSSSSDNSSVSSSISSYSSHNSSVSSSLSSSSPSPRPPTLGMLPLSSSAPSLPPVSLGISSPPALMPSSSTPPPQTAGLPPPLPTSSSKRRGFFSWAVHAAMTPTSTLEVHHAEMETHRTRSLLQYSYRFDKDPRGQEKRLLSNDLSEVSMEPIVHETWCLVVDKRNLVTVLRLAGGEIWPMGVHTSSSLFDKVPNCLRVAAWDYFHFQSHLGDLDGWTEFLRSFPGFSMLLLSGFAIFGILNDLISAAIPLVWIPAYVPRILPYLIMGRDVGLSLVLKVMSVVFTCLRAHRYHRTRGKGFHRVIRLFTKFLSYLGCYVGSPSLELCSPTLSQHINHWIEVEEKIRSQEEPPEEVFKALRSLWIIVIHFSMNFYAAPDGKVYRLNVHCAERRMIHIIRKGDKLLAHKIAAVENLERQLGVAIANIESVNQCENREMLRSIHRSAGCPAMSCMLRMCTITTPTRFVIASRDIGDLYARWIAQEEYLMRDSVTQSLVYLISSTEDELRILKGILKSQQKVIGQVARSYAKALVARHENRLDSLTTMRDWADRSNNSRSKTTSRKCPTKTCDGHNTDTPTNTKQGDDGTFQALLDSLQRRAHLKYDILMSEIERHEEAIARLKAQSALLISMKTERQGVAIFGFTLVTIIFLPLSFVTSYFGMNTSDIRDMEKGQSLFWTIAGPLTFFFLFISWLIARRGPTWKIYRQRKRLRDVEDWKWRYRD
ncbi:hypothetical protein V8F06_006682 [Rhypophila decipiens]